jgi:hypothetical protein
MLIEALPSKTTNYFILNLANLGISKAKYMTPRTASSQNIKHHIKH